MAVKSVSYQLQRVEEEEKETSMSKTFQRKEIKYLLTKKQKLTFMNAISDYISKDRYSDYTICNVYFDTPDSLLIRRSIDKPSYKEKMRIRSYGRADENSKVFIELKKKHLGIVYKRRITMMMEEANEYILGNASRSGQIEEEINYFLDYYKGVSPAMYISYDRKAYYVSDNPEIRITFDENILYRDSDLSLTSDIYGQPILASDECIMEIKCAHAMPLWLTKALSESKVYKTSFSKYGRAYMKKLA